MPGNHKAIAISPKQAEFFLRQQERVQLIAQTLMLAVDDGPATFVEVTRDPPQLVYSVPIAEPEPP